MKSILFSLFLISVLFPLPSLAEDEVEKVRKKCQLNEEQRTAYDCECIASAFKNVWGRNASSSPLQVYSHVMRSDAAKCLQPEKIHASSLGNCGRSYSLYQNHDKGNLGKTKFCHCVADETVKSLEGMNHHNIYKLLKGTTHGFDICGQKKEYAVPDESSLPKEEQTSIATLPPGGKISTADDTLYLIILNKNFDLNRLDPVRFAMSADYKPHLNLKYVTPKDYSVTTLPSALIKRGAVPPGVITPRAIEDVATMAEMYNQAILVKGSGLQAVMHEIKRVRAVKSADYYVLAGEEIYLVPDISSRF